MKAIDPSCEETDDFALADRLSELAKVPVPRAVEEIRNAPVRHKTVCEVDQMPDVVRNFLKKS